MIHREDYTDARSLANIEHAGHAFTLHKQKGGRRGRYVLALDGLPCAGVKASNWEQAAESFMASLRKVFPEGETLREPLKDRLEWLRQRGGCDID